MPKFELIFLGKDGMVRSRDTFDTNFDETARQVGSAMLFKSNAHVLEVRRGSAMIFRLAKANLPRQTYRKRRHANQTRIEGE